MKPPIPDNETARLTALERCEILDTAAEQGFDDITFLAAQLCGTPVALISLVDRERQWFKSRVGLDVTETPREIAFCAHAIMEPEQLMVVNDASKDLRFASNRLVVGTPDIRFYAGAPLLAETGEPIGTLCVIDRTPETTEWR